ncbi:MAG: hypothetical protein ACYTHJ_21205 [Planctomycetota bacterium]|jgi:hypothetical protein
MSIGKRACATARKLTAIGMAGLIWLAGCAVTVDDRGISSSFTIGGTTTTIGLGTAGIFIVQTGAITRNTADIQPFNDQPSSATVSLRSSSIIIHPPGGSEAKNAANQQTAISGTATMRLVIDELGTFSPCETGVEAG